MQAQPTTDEVKQAFRDALGTHPLGDLLEIAVVTDEGDPGRVYVLEAYRSDLLRDRGDYVGKVSVRTASLADDLTDHKSWESPNSTRHVPSPADARRELREMVHDGPNAVKDRFPPTPGTRTDAEEFYEMEPGAYHTECDAPRRRSK